MKFCLSILAIIALCNTSFGQDYAVKEGSRKVKGVTAPGMYIQLPLDGKMVEKEWSNRVKGFGKTTSSGGYTIVTEAVVAGVVSQAASVFTRAETKPAYTEIWWAIDKGSKGYVTSDNDADAFKKAEKALKEFGKDMYVMQVNTEISDAERVMFSAAKTHEKLVTDSINLVKKVDKNALDKKALEEKIRLLDEELVQLQLKQQQNSLDQIAALAEVEKLRQARDVIRRKLDNVK